MTYGTEVTFILHRAAHTLRLRVRDACAVGAPPDGIEDMVRSNLAAVTEEILRLPTPCGTNYAEPPVVRICERERGHDGEHRGNL
jgi:hypothetical protein